MSVLKVPRNKIQVYALLANQDNQFAEFSNTENTVEFQSKEDREFYSKLNEKIKNMNAREAKNYLSKLEPALSSLLTSPRVAQEFQENLESLFDRGIRKLSDFAQLLEEPTKENLLLFEKIILKSKPDTLRKQKLEKSDINKIISEIKKVESRPEVSTFSNHSTPIISYAISVSSDDEKIIYKNGDLLPENHERFILPPFAILFNVKFGGREEVSSYRVGDLSADKIEPLLNLMAIRNNTGVDMSEYYSLFFDRLPRIQGIQTPRQFLKKPLNSRTNDWNAVTKTIIFQDGDIENNLLQLINSYGKSMAGYKVETFSSLTEEEKRRSRESASKMPLILHEKELRDKEELKEKLKQERNVSIKGEYYIIPLPVLTSGRFKKELPIEEIFQDGKLTRIKYPTGFKRFNPNSRTLLSQIKYLVSTEVGDASFNFRGDADENINSIFSALIRVLEPVASINQRFKALIKKGEETTREDYEGFISLLVQSCKNLKEAFYRLIIEEIQYEVGNPDSKLYTEEFTKLLDYLITNDLVERVEWMKDLKN